MASASSESCNYTDFKKFPIYIGEVPGSSLDRYTGYIRVWWFFSVTHKHAAVPQNRTRSLPKIFTPIHESSQY